MRDISREKVYLVCYVVRLGGMEKTQTPSKTQAQQSDPMRRPFGVAAKDITLYVNGKLEPGEDDPVILPVLMSVLLIIDTISIVPLKNISVKFNHDDVAGVKKIH